MKHKKKRTAEDMKRLIVNHPLRAYMEIGVDFTDAVFENSEHILQCLNGMLKAVCVMLYCVEKLGECMFNAMRHMFLLAFYPLTKIYFIVGARREIMRNHPEYIQPAAKGQMR